MGRRQDRDEFDGITDFTPEVVMPPVVNETPVVSRPALRRPLKGWLELKKADRATRNALALRARDGTLYTEAEYDSLISARQTLVSGARSRS